MALANYLFAGSYTKIVGPRHYKDDKMIDFDIYVYSDNTKAKKIIGSRMCIQFESVLYPEIISTPPVSPSVGDKYFVGANAAGAWAGQENKFATWTTHTVLVNEIEEEVTEWVFDENTTGQKLWNVANECCCIYNGSSLTCVEKYDLHLWNELLALDKIGGVDINLYVRCYEFLKHTPDFVTCSDC